MEAHPTALAGRFLKSGNVAEKDPKCVMTFFKKMQIMLLYLNSEVQLYFALILSIECFDLNLAEGVYLH